jgi:hypothetical protein
VLDPTIDTDESFGGTFDVFVRRRSRFRHLEVKLMELIKSSTNPRGRAANLPKGGTAELA